jgi:hypothetical protein
MINNKSYYAIIPANVRYDNSLTPNAKLLYGEITALCNEKGFCWAKNEYFAELYNKTEISISKWIKALSDKNYIKLEYIKRGFEVLQRNIYLIDPLINVKSSIKEKFNGSIKEKFKENNTVINNTVNNTHEYKKKKRKISVFIKPSLEEFKNYFIINGYPASLAERAYKGYEEANWHKANGIQIINWKQTLWNGWFDEKNKIKSKKTIDEQSLEFVDYMNKKENIVEAMK